MRSIKIFSLVLFLISICLSQERGIGLREGEKANFQSFYKNSWAVVIGINDYIRAPKLKYAVRDAEEFTEVLVNYYGFKRENIIKLINREATKENIMKAFDKLRSVADKEDRVLVFFAGHGITVPLPDVAVSQLSFSRIFGDLFRQTFLFFNYFLPYFLHNRKQNRGYDTATQEERREREKS